MESPFLAPAIDILSKQFAKRNWKYIDVPAGSKNEKTYEWPGPPDDEIMICVHKGPDIQEMFHRQDFFFFNFAYLGNYGALSYQYNNRIIVKEGECYIGQPFAGYALSAHSEQEIIIMGVLIQRESFFKTFLPVLSSDAKLFRFFLVPQTNEYSDEFIHLRFENDFSIRTLLEMMVIEYANQRDDTQAILRPMVLTLLMQVARQYKLSAPSPANETLSDKIVRYMSEHTDVVTLKDIANHFSYHPNYISTLLRREIGKSFSEILLTQRMERALILLKGTSLPISEIAFRLGYSNPSNFHKAFRETYKMSPREYVLHQEKEFDNFSGKD